MECFCHKLSTQKFHNITESETAVLKTWAAWAEAARLETHPTTPPDSHSVIRASAKRPSSFPTQRARKQPRALPDSSSATRVVNQPEPERSQNIQPLPKPVGDLVNTYSSQGAVEVLGIGGDSLDIAQEGKSRSIKIYLAIERSNQNIETQQFIRRVYCYSFALLHQKNTSIDAIVQEIEDALPHAQTAIREKVYHIARIGEKWKAIIKDFGSPSTWERAKAEDRQSALRILSENTDIRKRTFQCAPIINKALSKILLEHAFIDETRRLTSQLQFSHDVIMMPRSNRISPNPPVPPRKNMHTLREASPAGNTSLVYVRKSVELEGTSSEDAKVLLCLLSFLSTSDKIPLDLVRGALPRKRWNEHGEIEEVNAVHIGLDPELRGLLSDAPRLSNAFDELDSSLATSKHGDHTYTLNEAVASRVRGELDAEHFSFWKRQALIITYRAIPWKYIESTTLNTNLLLPHLKHALQAFRGCYESLPVDTRVDLGLTLVQASRFPTMAWKRFAVDQARNASHGLEDWYLDCCIAQSQSLLSRVAGKIDHAISSLVDLAEGQAVGAMNTRMRCALDLSNIQRSLNSIQVEDLSTARRLLQARDILDQSLSPLENVVAFRKHTILGRVLRFQGAFGESLAHVKKARTMIGQCKDLIFDEELCDLTCDHADTLRELDDPRSSEAQIRTGIGRLSQHIVFPRRSLLDLCLAEALFAQRRFEEADELCLQSELNHAQRSRDEATPELDLEGEHNTQSYQYLCKLQRNHFKRPEAEKFRQDIIDYKYWEVEANFFKAESNKQLRDQSHLNMKIMTSSFSLAEVVLFLGGFEGLDNVLSLSENARYEFVPPDDLEISWLGGRSNGAPAGHVLCLTFGQHIYSPEGWICGSATEVDRADIQIAANNMGGVSRRHFLVDIEPLSRKPRLTVLGQMLRVTPPKSGPIVILKGQSIEVVEPLTIDLGAVSFQIWQPTLCTAQQQRMYMQKARHFHNEAVAALPRYVPSLSSGIPTVSPGIRVGRSGAVYLSKGNVGKGMSATVMLVERQDTLHKTTYVAKEPYFKASDDPGAIQYKWEETRHEFEQLTKFHHPHVVTAFDVASSKDVKEPPWLIMEYLPETLIPKSLDEGAAMVVATHILSALAHIHSEDLVHGDIKPSNILINREGGLIAKLADFGLAQYYVQEGLHVLVGTPLYWAPELRNCAPRYTHMTDMFSFGLVLLECFSSWDPSTDSQARQSLGPESHRKWMRELVIPTVNNKAPERLRPLLRGLLRRVPENRWSALSCLQWLSAMNADLATPSARAPLLEINEAQSIHESKSSDESKGPGVSDRKDQQKQQNKGHPSSSIERDDSNASEVASLTRRASSFVPSDIPSVSPTIPISPSWAPTPGLDELAQVVRRTAQYSGQDYNEVEDAIFATQEWED
ncbi:Calcium-dependent protein kinase 1 [Paramyrothecium foliicola]|nr:Calcium-dependent protein kinase 1 [Paramyrothecium foliicola]